MATHLLSHARRSFASQFSVSVGARSRFASSLGRKMGQLEKKVEENMQNMALQTEKQLKAVEENMQNMGKQQLEVIEDFKTSMIKEIKEMTNATKTLSKEMTDVKEMLSKEFAIFNKPIWRMSGEEFTHTARRSIPLFYVTILFMFYQVFKEVKENQISLSPLMKEALHRMGKSDADVFFDWEGDILILPGKKI